MNYNESSAFYEQISRRLGSLGTAALRRIPAESAHNIGLSLMRNGVLNFLRSPIPRVDKAICLKTKLPLLGSLDHPIGLAAGFDKNASCLHGLKKMGFSFLEVGTITPLAQKGNAKPRMFRLSDQRSIINRLGFNNEGAQKVLANIESQNWDKGSPPLGINAGKNKFSSLGQATDDYISVINRFRSVASYFVLNISSPNTEGLRTLANKDFLQEIAFEINAIDKNLINKVWIKLDPDMPKNIFKGIIETIGNLSFGGLILSNTHKVEYPQMGGQSGHPLAVSSTQCLEHAYDVHKGRLAMIGCGGILSGTDAFQKIIRGATALQIYTALVYRGPWAVSLILEELAQELKLHGFSSVEDAMYSFYL